jgi:antitoxin component HigA of HigAB toxin-antitoxin module
MPKVFTKQDLLEALHYIWGMKPIDHLFHGEVEQFHEDLDLASITEAEYKDYARNKPVISKRRAN